MSDQTDERALSEETRMLLGHLGTQRQHVVGILEGLDDEAMRRTVLASGWSCISLLRHLTLDVEQFWFRAVMAGELDATAAVIDETDGWAVADDLTGAEAIAAYLDAAARSDAVIAATGLDAPPGWWPEGIFGGWRVEDLREVLLHVIVETATHAGHLDAVREIIDGRQWMVLT